MDNPTMDQAFEKHVQDYLCSESYDFLKDVSVLLGPEDVYLVQGSSCCVSATRLALLTLQLLRFVAPGASMGLVLSRTAACHVV